MKQIQGSVLMSTFMHGPSFFRFTSCHFQFLSPNYWTTFTILRLYMAWKMRKINARTWEISSWRLVEKFYISVFPMYYSLYNWIGEHENTKQKKYLLRIQKQAQKDMNEMEWHKMDYLIFSAMSMPKRHLFCTSSQHNVPYEKKQELNKGSEPWNECPC